MLDWITEIHSQLIQPDRLPIAAAATILSAFTGVVAGNLRRGLNVNALMGTLINSLFTPVCNRLNRKGRRKGDLIFRGFLVTILAALFAYMLALAISNALNIPTIAGLHPYTEIIPLSLCLTCGGVWHMLLTLYRTIERKKAGQGGFLSLSRSSNTNLSDSDEYAITRTAIGYTARIFDRGLVAPVFWYLLFGLEGTFIYTALATLSHHYGKNGQPNGFGAVPLAMEKLMGFIPTLLSGTLIALASTFSPTASLQKTIKLLAGIASRTIKKGIAPYEQGGLPLSIMAWTLNITLGGTTKDLSGDTIKSTWVGPPSATAKIHHPHLRRAVLIHMGATLLLLAVLGGAYVWSGVSV